MIHPTAVIGIDVHIDESVEIHPYVVIYDHVTICKGVQIYPFAVLGKPPTSPDGLLKRKPQIPQYPLVIGDETIISPHTTIYLGSKIGKRCLIGDGASIRENVEIGDDCLISRFVTINSNTRIGNHVKIMDSSHITGDMLLEDNVYIAPLVATSNDSVVGDRMPDWDRGAILRKGAGVGLGAILFANIEIGEGAIVAAGSVVTKSVAPNTMVMGVPARERRGCT